MPPVSRCVVLVPWVGLPNPVARLSLRELARRGDAVRLSRRVGLDDTSVALRQRSFQLGRRRPRRGTLRRLHDSSSHRGLDDCFHGWDSSWMIQ